MTLTARSSTIAQRFYTIMKAELELVQFALHPELTIQQVYYGDQDKVPVTPVICVEAGDKRREWPPRPTLMSENVLECHFIVYHTRMDTSTQEAKIQADLLGDLIEEYINIQHTRLKDANGDDLVIHGHVVDNDPGYINRGTSRWHASHLLWRGISKTRITEAG